MAYGPDGEPRPSASTCPAPGIDGYSLDLMRRDDGWRHPNGLIDFVVVATIEHLRDRGCDGLGLNFATMRAVLAGEAGDSLAATAASAACCPPGRDMQIESLWRFNAKFDPRWLPRYVVVDGPTVCSRPAWPSPGRVLWELPLIGRLPATGDGHARRLTDWPSSPRRLAAA